MKFRYNHEKNAKLITERGIGFEEILDSISAGNLLQIVEHHNTSLYPYQKILQVRCLHQVYCVPFVIEDDGTMFLKTLYPSRKANKLFLL